MLDRTAAMAALKAFGKAFNRADVDGILAVVTDDFEWRLHEGPDAPDGRVVRGREAVRQALAERAERIESLRFSETEVMFGDDHAVGRFRATGAYRDGRPIDVRGIDIYGFRDGRISVKDSYWKAIG
mgnify:CR=1 FL=1